MVQCVEVVVQMLNQGVHLFKGSLHKFPMYLSFMIRVAKVSGVRFLLYVGLVVVYM